MNQRLHDATRSHGHDDHEPHVLSRRFAAHAHEPRYLGTLPDADGRAVGVGSCGDAIEVSLSFDEGRVRDIRHAPRGCTYTVACGSAMCELACGRSLEELLWLTPEDVAAALGGLPDDHMHCASLAVNTLGEALEDYYRKIWGRDAAGKQIKKETPMKQILIITNRPDEFAALAEGIQDHGPASIAWADSEDVALAAVSGKTVDLAVIDETVGDRSGLAVARSLLMKNAMINQAVVSRLTPEAFHEASEGLGVMAQLPSKPGAGDANPLMETLHALTGR